MQVYLHKGNQIHACRPLQIRGERMSGEMILSIIWVKSAALY